MPTVEASVALDVNACQVASSEKPLAMHVKTRTATAIMRITMIPVVREKEVATQGQDGQQGSNRVMR
ncbi:hypothetical protein BK654_25540 [Pseudomonas brassicacearum]|nr:hypothetical protein BK654_25540 [Pseudomonas brassicacearum]